MGPPLWLWIMIGLVMGSIAFAIGAGTNMHKRVLAHRERMKELELEQLRLEGGANNYLPSPSDTLIRRGLEQSGCNPGRGESDRDRP